MQRTPNKKSTNVVKMPASLHYTPIDLTVGVEIEAYTAVPSTTLEEQ